MRAVEKSVNALTACLRLVVDDFDFATLNVL
jgi:hypothetical protein